MHAEQLLEFLEQHIDELPHLMGAEEWRAFQAELHASVQQQQIPRLGETHGTVVIPDVWRRNSANKNLV
jgi:hypothetical protein